MDLGHGGTGDPANQQDIEIWQWHKHGVVRPTHLQSRQ